MSDYLLSVPEEIYLQARQIADLHSLPVEQVILDYLRVWFAPLPSLSMDEEAELEALKHLSDDALWTIAREQLPSDVQEQMQSLMDRNSAGSISPDERNELEQLVERSQRLMVRKSEASALLTKRGYKVSSKDLTGRE